MLFLTHLAFALAIGSIMKFPLKTTAIAGVVADADTIFFATGFGFPLIHRGIFHTPVFLGLAMIAIYFATRRTDICAGFGAGFLSHLFLDTINPTGIMWLYPFTTMFLTMNIATYSNPVANWGIVFWSIVFILAFNPKTIGKIPEKFRLTGGLK
ncbi:MAG: metal-dependent hydrolase [Candidatus Aenigmatarchaeota archaeon]